MSEKIRIAHLLYRLDYGGLENGVVNMINGLPSNEFSHTVVSLTDSTDFRRRLPENVPVVELRKQPGKSPAYLYRAWKALKGGHFDILHTRNMPCLESQVAGLLAGIPIRIHGEHGWDVFDLDGTRPSYRMLRKAISPLVTRYVVVSRQLGLYLTRNIGIDPVRVIRICNGVDTGKFTPAESGLSIRPLVVGAVGRIEKVKDYLTLARAFTLAVRESRLSAQLVVAGDGSERAGIEDYIRAQGLSEAAMFTGLRNDIPRILRTFSVFVLPSLAEGISNTILEAMASGLPIIATNVGGNDELVSDGETGFLVPPADPGAIASRLVFYSKNPEVLLRHGQAARERAVREFSLGEMTSRYRSLYLDCVAAAGPRRAIA